MVMRTYIPGPEIVEQKWAPPAVQVESRGDIAVQEPTNRPVRPLRGSGRITANPEVIRVDV